MRDYPHSIRRKQDQRLCSETYNNKGYVLISLNDGNGYHQFRKHRLIAEQFIPNSDNFPCVDHINHIRDDNRIENLRWCSASDNNLNKSFNNGVQYEFVDSIPVDSIKVLFYDTRCERRNFDDNKYFYNIDEDIFYGRITDTLYKVLHINVIKDNTNVVYMKDVDNKSVGVVINRFKRQYDL